MHMEFEMSYGIDFDPVTGKLWDTENGPAFGDEINLVRPGFNSGWRKVQGIWNVREITAPGGRINSTDLDNKAVGLDSKGLENFGRQETIVLLNLHGSILQPLPQLYF